MTKISNNELVADMTGLPSPDTAADATSSDQVATKALPRPMAAINDTGRIKFGAACRIPTQK